MDERQTLELARQALQQGNKEGARKLLVQLLQANPRNETAWLWLSAIIGDPAKERDCLQRVLRINPSNQVAQQHLMKLQTSSSSPQSQPVPSVSIGGPDSDVTSKGRAQEHIAGEGRKALSPWIWGVLAALVVLVVLVLGGVSLLFLGGRLALVATPTPTPVVCRRPAVDVFVNQLMALNDRAADIAAQGQAGLVSASEQVRMLRKVQVDLNAIYVPCPAAQTVVDRYGAMIAHHITWLMLIDRGYSPASVQVEMDAAQADTDAGTAALLDLQAQAH